jgi:hypothetical protein
VRVKRGPRVRRGRFDLAKLDCAPLHFNPSARFSKSKLLVYERVKDFGQPKSAILTRKRPSISRPFQLAQGSSFACAEGRVNPVASFRVRCEREPRVDNKLV